jgi:hypothetical protein
MPKLTAMPSPSGRNAERLFLPGRLAADSATSTSTSTSISTGASASAKALSQLQMFHGAKLSNPEDQAMAESLLTALLEAITPDDDDDESDDPDLDDDQATAQDKKRRKLAGDRVQTLRRAAARVTFDSYRRCSEKMARLFPDAVKPRQY